MVNFLGARICDDMQIEVHKSVMRSMTEMEEFCRILGSFSVEIIGFAADTGVFTLKFHDKDKKRAKTICDGEIIEVTPEDMMNIDLKNKAALCGKEEGESDDTEMGEKGR